MNTKSFKYTSYAITILQKIIGSRFTVSGLENIPKNQPIMFVANHFTRSETFFVPYLIHKYTDRQVRCLADSSLYHGFLGRFLTNVGTVSTKDANRDKIIIKDLVNNNYDWLIYPEGSMVKNKKIEKRDLYVSHTPYGVGPIKTGSAVLALKSHLYRQDLIEGKERNDEMALQDLKNSNDLEYKEGFEDIKTFVVALSISYYPIRPGENKIELFAKKRIEKMSPRLSEELQIEGNILMQSEIHLHFSQAIDLSQYTKMTRGLVYQIPIIKNETKTNFIIKYFKHRLTNDLMSKIYSNIQVNLDHIFSAILRVYDKDSLKIIDLKRMIYLSALMIVKSKKYIINNSIKEENLFKIFCDETNLEFDGVFELAKNLGEISQIDDETIVINKSCLYEDRDFHQVRLNSTLQVIFNEFVLLENALNIVRRNVKLSSIELQEKTIEYLINKDKKDFENDYEKYFDKNFSKSKEIGYPRILRSKNKKGILLCHGYKSSPKEVEALAKFLNEVGFNIYLVRLKGHATSPINMQDISFLDWYNSLQIGYAILYNFCEGISLVGFSTGGLISLLLAANNNSKKLKSVISINSALKLQDIRASFVPAINLWNEFLHKMHIEKGLFEYVDDKPENPDFNYSRNYLKGVEELEKLMKICEENLAKISIDSLIIQGKNDPVVNPVSAEIIFEKINSKNKFLSELDFSNHVIINGEKKEIVFKEIENFLTR